jgi:hypothetical protein
MENSNCPVTSGWRRGFAAVVGQITSVRREAAATAGLVLFGALSTPAPVLAQSEPAPAPAASAVPAEPSPPLPGLVLNLSEWLVGRDPMGTVILYPVVRGTQLRDLSQPGWRIESDIVSGAMVAVPTRSGSELRDERREPVALAPNAAAQILLVAPAGAGGVVVVGRSGRKGMAPGPVPRSGALPPRPEHGFVVPPSHSVRPMIAPLIRDFPTR